MILVLRYLVSFGLALSAACALWGADGFRKGRVR